MKPPSVSRRRCYPHALLTIVFTSPTSPIAPPPMFVVPSPNVPLHPSTYRQHVLLGRSALAMGIKTSIIFPQ